MLLLSRLSKLNRIKWDLPRVSKIHTIFKKRQTVPQLSALRPSLLNVVPKRTFILKKIGWKPTQRQIKENDNVPFEFTLIYQSTLGKYLTIAQIAMTLTTGILIIFFCLNTDYESYDLRYEEWSQKTKRVEHEGLIYLSMFILILVLLQVTMSQIPLRIYKIPKTPNYVMIFNSNIPFSKNRLDIRRGSIHYLDQSSGIVPWKEQKYLITKGNYEKRVVLFDHYFRRPADLSIMLGEQRDPEME